MENALNAFLNRRSQVRILPGVITFSALFWLQLLSVAVGNAVSVPLLILFFTGPTSTSSQLGPPPSIVSADRLQTSSMPVV
jgi:hypothetical protein